MEINWFPGHMAKTLREMKDHLKRVEIVLETCDARIPESSRNPELDRILGQKPRILLLNKADLADPKATAVWLEFYRAAGITALACESTRHGGLDQVRKTIISMNRQKIDQAMAKGRLIRPIRVMVAGIPNTGKSTLINNLCGKKAAQVADRPGVTRSSLWVRAGSELELMDTPGVLWPRLGSLDNKICLAATGAIRDELLPVEEVAAMMLRKLSEHYPELISQRYKLATIQDEEGRLLSEGDLIGLAAKKRGCLLPGGKIDVTRFAILFLDELRAGRIGRMTLEWPKPAGQSDAWSVQANNL